MIPLLPFMKIIFTRLRTHILALSKPTNSFENHWKMPKITLSYYGLKPPWAKSLALPSICPGAGTKCQPYKCLSHCAIAISPSFLTPGHMFLHAPKGPAIRCQAIFNINYVRPKFKTFGYILNLSDLLWKNFFAGAKFQINLRRRSDLQIDGA